jgi:glycosyltransferase involved in cell wall biosynthesis
MPEPLTIRIAFVITGLSTGGAELMLLRLLEHLDRRRFEAHVITLTDAGDVGERISALGIGLLELGMSRGLPTPRALWRLTQFLRQWRPSLVHTWMYHADLLGSLASILAGCPPVVWCIRASTLDKTHTSALTRLTVKACAFISHLIPTRIISCSHTAARVHVASGYRSDKIVVIPNGFDLDRFHPLPEARAAVRAELGLSNSALLVGLIARFDPLKNHFAFLTAASRLHKSLPGVHFLLAGSGVDHQNHDLIHAVQRSGLLSTVHLVGQRNDVPRLMAAMDLLVSPSIGEAFPNAVGEAMACGVPCVVTDVGDSAFIVGDTGRVVPPSDTEALAEAMRSLLSLPPQTRHKLGRAALQRIREHFEIRSVVQQFETLYERVANERRFANAAALLSSE